MPTLEEIGLNEDHVDRMITAIYAAYKISHKDEVRELTRSGRLGLGIDLDLGNRAFHIMTGRRTGEVESYGVCNKMSINNRPWLSLYEETMMVMHDGDDELLTHRNCYDTWHTEGGDSSRERPRQPYHSPGRAWEEPCRQDVFGLGQASDRGDGERG